MGLGSSSRAAVRDLKLEQCRLATKPKSCSDLVRAAADDVFLGGLYHQDASTFIVPM